MSRRPLLPVLALAALASACSCGQPGPGPRGVTIDLLARAPDARYELPGAILPQGEAPGFATWGISDGPGWAQTDHKAPAGFHYLETNQARAGLMLPAPRKAERELVLALWCARPAGPEPAPVTVRLNDIVLAEGLTLGREPAEVRVLAPAPAWLVGENWLELEVPLQADGTAWDTLALARVVYGPEARVETGAGRLALADGTGVRYALELAEPALVTLAGRASGPGELAVRTGELDPRTGALALEEPPVLLTARDGALRGEVPLTRRAGKVRVLELLWEGPDGATLALERLTAREAGAAPRPPIVLVSIDTFAARHLSLYGYGRRTSPELERLRADAVLFERCLANAPWTLTSYLSVLSGLYPRAHNVALRFQAGADLAPHDWWQLADNRWTLAEALRARGYRTAGFVDTQWLRPTFGFEQGFDLYNGEGALADFHDPHAHIEHIVTRLVPPWLASAGPDSPPFLFLHALDAHGPYLPNAPYRDTFAADLAPELTLVPAGSDNQTYRWMPWWMSRTMQPDESVPEKERVPLEEVVARYDETLLKVDAFLGQLFAELRTRGLYDEAVIVVTGDHGEFFGPEVYGHGVMREAVLHVPLLVKLPGNRHGGRSVSEPVALVDVYPTLLELAGVPPDPERLHGASLLARIESTSRAERPHFSESGHVEQYALTLGCWRLVEEFPGSESSDAALLSHPRVPDEWLRRHAPEILARPLSKPLLAELLARPGFPARLRELRALVAGPYHGLYDTCRDPAQLVDLSAQEPERLAHLKKLLEAEKARARAAQAEARPVRRTAALSPADLEALEALGYGGEATSEKKDDAGKGKAGSGGLEPEGKK
ncbi:MAG TPA: sulfatase [Planctomycetota bacterium]